MSNTTGSLGYRIQEADDIAKSIVTMYNDITGEIKDGWGTVSSEFVKKWNNTLSEKYEIALSKHMANVHLSTGALLKDLSLNFINGLNQFISDETSQTVSYGGEVIAVEYDLKSYMINPTDSQYNIDYVNDNGELKNIVTPSVRDYSSGQMLLEDAEVAQTLYNIIDTYVGNVKDVVNNSIGNIEDKTAFEGPSSTTAFAEKVASVKSTLANLDSWLYNFQEKLSELVGVTITSEGDVASYASSSTDETNPNQEVF